MTSKQVNKIDIDCILEHYLICALWSSTNEELGTHFDEHFSTSDFCAESIDNAKKDIRAFLLLAPKKTVKKMELSQIGHDFWLTRNHHGAGFWDRNLGELGDKLTEISKQFTELNLFENNGKVIIE